MEKIEERPGVVRGENHLISGDGTIVSLGRAASDQSSLFAVFRDMTTFEMTGRVLFLETDGQVRMSLLTPEQRILLETVCAEIARPPEPPWPGFL